MIRYFDAEKYAFNFEIEDNFPVLSDDQQNEIDSSWTETLVRHPNAFNGGIWSCHRMSVGPDQVMLGVNKTDYATYQWVRNKGLVIPGTWTMGTGLIIYDNKDNLILAQRTAKVVSDPNKISVAAGGVVDTSIEPNDNFLEMVTRQMKKEIEEELVIDGDRYFKLLWAAVDDTSLKVEWAYGIYAANRVAIIDFDENVGLIAVPRINLEKFVKSNIDNLELSTRWHLGYLTTR